MKKITLKGAKILNNIGVQTFICFGFPWLAYFLFLLVAKDLYYSGGTDIFLQRLMKYSKQIWFWCNFLPSIFLFGIGLLIHYTIGRKKTFSFREMILPVIILIATDQVIQFFIVTYHDSIHLVVVENWLTIIPWFTQSKGDGFISTGQVPLLMRIAVNLLIVPFVYVLFRILHFFEQNRKYLFVSLLFYTAGYVCSCLNLIFYKSGYDYIYLYPLVILDLKDIYINIGIYTLAQSMMQNAAILKKVHLKDIKKYGDYEYQTIKWCFFRKKCKDV
jgi:hypothetical protein